MNTYINGLIRLDWTCHEQNDSLSAKYLILGWKMGLRLDCHYSIKVEEFGEIIV